MATRYGRTRHADTVTGTDEDDRLYGWSEGDTVAADFMRDILEGGRGDDFLFGGGGADILRGGADNDTLFGGWGSDELDGGEGIDTAIYVTSPQPVYVNLLAGFASVGEADGDTFISVENVVGSDHDDVILGDNGRNVLQGRDGDDRIYGEDGDDDLYGDDGIDRLYGGEGRDWLRGGADTDYLRGEDGADWLDGGDGDDFLYGGRGPDVFYGSQGADLFNGGDDGHADYADYQGSEARVVVNLQTGRGSGGLAEGDRYESIEDVRGTRAHDSITGNDWNNTLYGGQGHDGLSGGGGDDHIEGEAGADKLDGGSHVNGDTLSYHSSDAGVNILLGKGYARFGHAEGDTFTGFEHVRGSTYDDTLHGDNGNNNLSGNWGRDELRGFGGADNLTGGYGADRFIFGSVSDSMPTALGTPVTHDWIYDLDPSDFIDLSAIDANTTATAAGNQPFTLVDAPAFTGAGQLRIEVDARGDWIVLGETTGDRVADLMIGVSRHHPLLDVTDFHFIF